MVNWKLHSYWLKSAAFPIAIMLDHDISHTIEDKCGSLVLASLAGWSPVGRPREPAEENDTFNSESA